MTDAARNRNPTPRRVALAHDWLCGYRGGEGVLDAIARLVESDHQPAHLLVMFDDRRPVTPAIDRLPKIVSPLGTLPGASGPLRRWLLPLYPTAVGSLARALRREHAREPIDLLVSTSSAAIKGLRAPQGVPHVCYCHAPARYVWSQRDQYARGNPLKGAGLALFAGSFKRWDRQTASNVDLFLANSTHTAAQIHACFGRESQVLPPPVRTDLFTPPPPEAPRGDHWLVVSALEPYKRVDLAIDAARAAGRELRIVGDGSSAPALRAKAGPGVRFLGRIPDAALIQEYRSAAALLFPQIEDFGIVAVEAQACGLPVVARRAGGAIDSIIEGETGVFFDEPTPEAVVHAAGRCPSNPDACRRNAERFSEAAFAGRLRAILARVLG